ncbi:hypothetical protein M9458_045981, partial [Cirrhinus mrigala]
EFFAMSCSRSLGTKITTVIGDIPYRAFTLHCEEFAAGNSSSRSEFFAMSRFRSQGTEVMTVTGDFPYRGITLHCKEFVAGNSSSSRSEFFAMSRFRSLGTEVKKRSLYIAKNSLQETPPLLAVNSLQYPVSALWEPKLR